MHEKSMFEKGNTIIRIDFLYDNFFNYLGSYQSSIQYDYNKTINHQSVNQST